MPLLLQSISSLPWLKKGFIRVVPKSYKSRVGQGRAELALVSSSKDWDRLPFAITLLQC